MPDNELNKILDDILFWPRSKLPTAPQMLVLEHLALPGSPRLYLRGYENGYLVGGVSNSESVAGWDLRCDAHPFVHQWYGPPLEWWVERDEALSGDKRKEFAVYKISLVGRAVIKWAHSQGRYGAKTPPSPQALANMKREDEE